MDLSSAIEKITGKLQSWLDLFISMLPNMAVALILLILFVVLSKAGVKIFRKIFAKTSDNQALLNLFSTIIYYSIMSVGLFVILGILKLDKAVTSLLAGIGVIGLALGFAFQNITANFVSGIILAFRTPFQVGDVIMIKDIMGRVVRTNLRVTVVRTFQGQEVYIPNQDVLQSAIYNFTTIGQRRIDLTVGVSYAEDLEKVEKLVRETVTRLDGVISPDELIFDYESFGDSAINFNIRFWIEYPDQPGYLAMRNRAIKAIKTAFDKHNITIPFPIRTLDFGIKGGKKLSEMNISLKNGQR